jgi:hypothetical protein
VKGDTGPAGPQGLQGLRGEIGPAGPQGIQGLPGVKGDTGPVGSQGLQGLRGEIGPTGPQGIQGLPGVKGDTGPVGPQGLRGEIGAVGPRGCQGEVGPIGPQGEAGLQGLRGEIGPAGPQGEAAAINQIRVIMAEPGTQAYAYNAGTRSLADFVFVIPQGATGPAGANGRDGADGAPGATGPKGATGPQGRDGTDAYAVFGGMFNTAAGEFEVQPDEVVAMTFSDFLPAQGVWYDDHHSVVLSEAGVYEVSFTLRAESRECGYLRVAITNDGAIIPSSQVNDRVGCRDHFTISGKAVTTVQAGAHLHFIIFAKEYAKFLLHEGVNLMLYVKKLAELPQS